MIHVDTVQVLTESESRMDSKLFEFSHRKDGFSFYSIKVTESEQEDLDFVKDSLVRQGIPANIYPDRFGDNVTLIRFSPKGELLLNYKEYKYLLSFITESVPFHETPSDISIFLELLNDWNNQIKYGNIYSLSQFMKPSEDNQI